MNKKLRRDCLVQFREAVQFLPQSTILELIFTSKDVRWQ
jgi:hypothetical protein